MTKHFIKKKSPRKRRQKPEHHVGMKFGKGWLKRSFLREVIIPSLFVKRHGVPQPADFPELIGEQVCITWIGHASFLIQTTEHNILIDPNWARWLKVIKRIKHPGIKIHDLPAIDLVLITHAHFDHLDRKTLRAIAANQPIVVPEHVGNLVHNLGFNKVHELHRWETIEHEGLKITLTPASHWGARVLHDQHRGFGGFLIEYKGRTIFHCGDSAYFSGFEDIGKFANIDIALLPIGAYDAPTKREVHMNPEQALQAFKLLNAKIFVPMHYGTFRLSYEPLAEPPQRLIECAQKEGLANQIHLLIEGKSTVF